MPAFPPRESLDWDGAIPTGGDFRQSSWVAKGRVERGRLLLLLDLAPGDEVVAAAAAAQQQDEVPL